MHLQKVTIRPERFPTKEHYPFNLDVFAEPLTIRFTTPVTFFVGENGTGKSTLLQALCRKCGIHIWGGVKFRRMKHNPYEDKLYKAIDITWSDGAVPGSYFASETFRNFAQLLDEWCSDDPGMLDYFGGKSLMTQSHGQSILSFFKARYSRTGLYLLDEPETALSPTSQIQLLHILKEIPESERAQFIIATHSPILLACPGATIFSFDTTPISRIKYKDTNHYAIYRDFFSDRNKILEDL